MISFTEVQLYAWITSFLWPFARLLALMGAGPMFSESSSPTLVKVGLAAVLAVVVAPTLPAFPAVSPGSYAGLWILAQQIVIGTAMGFTMRIFFTAVQTAGDFVGLQMGLSLATLYDPTTRASTEVMASLFNIVAMLVFVTINGHLLMLDLLIKTFTILPIGDMPLHADGLNTIAQLGVQVFSSGLLLALPLIAALLTINLALGILNRAAPQLSAFSVGFPITLIAGVLLLTAILPQTPSFLQGLFQQALQAMERVAETLAAG
jgi:flagellar biosynthetic protein FliR